MPQAKLQKYYFVKEAPDYNELFNFKNADFAHVLGNGQTGSGKSTMLRMFMLRYIERGFTVLAREVGKYDFISRFQYIQDIIDYYKSDEYTQSNKMELIQFWKKKQKEIGEDIVVVINHPSQIQQGKINILTFDTMPGLHEHSQVVMQYHAFLKALRIRREQNPKEFDIVIFIDEANKIMPSINKIPLTKRAGQLVREMVNWMTEWRGYHVKFFLSTHTMNQLHIDARAACGMLLIKQSNRFDAKELMTKELFHISDEEFTSLYKQIQSMDVSKVLYLDRKRQYQMIPIPFAPEKYDVDECKDFIALFDVEPLIKPIDRTWEQVKVISEELLKEIDVEDRRAIFIPKMDEELQIAKVSINDAQFLNYLFSFNDYKDLFEDDWFIERRLLKGVQVYYEKHWLLKDLQARNEELEIIAESNVNSKLVEQQKQERLLQEISLDFDTKKYDEVEAGYLILETNPTIANNPLAELLSISEHKATRLKVKIGKLGLQHERARKQLDINISFLEWYQQNIKKMLLSQQNVSNLTDIQQT